jgi:hypothetical protein
MLNRLAHHVARNAIAWIALFVALGGASYAAIKIPANSVGNRQLKRNAVTSSKVRDHSLLAADFKAGQLQKGAAGAQGPAGATGATGPTGPVGPSSATEVFVDGDVTANTGTAKTVATLTNLPAGSYVITSKTVGRSAVANDAESACVLSAGTDTDRSQAHLNNGAPGQTQVNQLTTTTTASGNVTLSCTPSLQNAIYSNTKIVAVKLGAESHTAG